MEEENAFWESLKVRANHLRELEQGSFSETATADFNQFFAMKLDRTILDYLLR